MYIAVKVKGSCSHRNYERRFSFLTALDKYFFNAFIN